MFQSQRSGGKDKLSSLLYLIGPFILLWSFFWLVPLIGSFEQSFEVSPQSIEKRDLKEHSAWLNYERAFKDTKFIKSLENTLLFCWIYSSDYLVDWVFSGICIVRSNKAHEGICLFVLLIPSLALPGTLATLFYLFFHGKAGALSQFLIVPLGFEPINWMMDPD